MTIETLSKTLSERRGDKPCPSLSPYSVKAIESGNTSFSVKSLIAYCSDIGIRFYMIDLNTNECYDIDEVQNVHQAIQMLMDRYNVTATRIYNETGVHYTQPKDDDTSLSIKTLLCVCQSLHCELCFL